MQDRVESTLTSPGAVTNISFRQVCLIRKLRYTLANLEEESYGTTYLPRKRQVQEEETD